MRFGGLILAILFAAVAAVIVLRMSANDQQAAPTAIGAAPPVETVNVYVAAQPIPVGSEINESMIAIQPWPKNLALEGFMYASGDGATSPVKMIARAPFQQQEPLLSSKLANKDDPNFLAGSLPKGMRAITIQTNEIEGLAGFIFPGDRVDVILTHDVSKWVSPPTSDGAASPLREETDTITETLLTNVVVLAVDQRATASNATDDKGNLVIPRSVSLMVSPSDAQRLRLGQQKGTLTLALRSLEDRTSSDPLTVTGTPDISQYQEQAGETNSGGGVLVVRGTKAAQSESNEPAPAADPANPQGVAPNPQGLNTSAAPPPVAAPTPTLSNNP